MGSAARFQYGLQQHAHRGEKNKALSAAEAILAITLPGCSGEIPVIIIIQ